jgi:16S rRNA (guanine527-N7)-methyltransferase
MELASPLLQKGGRLVCYKALVDDEELRNARALQNLLNMKLVSDRTVQLDDKVRRLIVFEKQGKPRVKLPRKTGLAQKKPLTA